MKRSYPFWSIRKATLLFSAGSRQTRIGLGIFNGFQNLLDNLRMKDCSTMERNDDAAMAFLVDAVTAFGPEPRKTRFQKKSLPTPRL